jgi:hypothetical protein
MSKLGDVVKPCTQQGTNDIPDMPPYPALYAFVDACNATSRVISRAAFEKLAAGLLPPLKPFTNQTTLPAHYHLGTTMSM